MSNKSASLRIYVEVQSIIRDSLKKGIEPTTAELQKTVYGENYNPDSRIQKGTIYKCILLGRENVMDLWDFDIQDNDKFIHEIKKIGDNQNKAIKNELESSDFKEFYWEMQHGRFGEDTKEIKKSLGLYPAIALLFNEKMSLYSEQGNNFLISRNGRNSSWYIPSWWKWNVREYNLYRRTLKILRTQLQRGIETKVLMPSGQPLEKALESETIVRAMLENSTVWTCLSCGIRNIETSTNCANCKTPKP